MLGPGTTLVTLTAKDVPGGLTSSCVAKVTLQVVTAPPTISVSVNPALLWPPNHKLVAVTATITASDASAKRRDCLESVTSSEPDNGFGDGCTPGYHGHFDGDNRSARMASAAASAPARFQGNVSSRTS